MHFEKSNYYKKFLKNLKIKIYLIQELNNLLILKVEKLISNNDYFIYLLIYFFSSFSQIYIINKKLK